MKTQHKPKQNTIDRWQRGVKAAQEVDYPAYGITGPGPSQNAKNLSIKTSPSTSPSPSPSTSGAGVLGGGGGGLAGVGWLKSPKLPAAVAASGDKKLAHSAHMFHFQHQKQQVIAMERCVHHHRFTMSKWQKMHQQKVAPFVVRRPTDQNSPPLAIIETRRKEERTDKKNPSNSVKLDKTQ